MCSDWQTPYYADRHIWGAQNIFCSMPLLWNVLGVSSARRLTSLSSALGITAKGFKRRICYREHKLAEWTTTTRQNGQKDSLCKPFLQSAELEDTPHWLNGDADKWFNQTKAPRRERFLHQSCSPFRAGALYLHNECTSFNQSLNVRVVKTAL